MGCNPCCCWNVKDAAVTIGIWSLVFSIASLVLFGWQTQVLNNCRAVTMAQSNLQCEWDCPCVGASTKRTSSIIEGLFVIQVLCLICVFFLLFASIALIYGVHTWSRYLIWPWFPCMISTILTALAYCIMWWAGDVRDYWLALTILEIIGVFINTYCVVVVMMFYRRLEAETDHYEGKRTHHHRASTRHASRRDLIGGEEYDSGLGLDALPPLPCKSPYTPYPHTPYSAAPSGWQPVTPAPVPPYPVDKYEKEPRTPAPVGDRMGMASRVCQLEDPLVNWVRDQQERATSHANSEPISPTRPHHTQFKHAHSAHSLFDGSLTSHKDCRHGERRSGRSRSRARDHHETRSRSRDHNHEKERREGRRSRSRARSVSQAAYSSESDSQTEYRRDDRRRRRSGSRRRGREKEERDDENRRWRRSRRRDDDTMVTESAVTDRRDRNRSSGRRRRDKDERESERERDGYERRSMRRVKREDKEKERRRTNSDDEQLFSKGITIPQRIVIPPGGGTRGADGRIEPQKYQINSEITIKYDKDSMISGQGRKGAVEEPRSKREVMSITTNV